MPAEPVRAAVVQVLADTDTARNVARAGNLVEAAAAAGARLVVLPEKWNWWGPASATASGAEALEGPSLSAARAWARDLGVAIVAGSVLEAIGDGSRAFNTSVLIGPDGRDVATYRKIHLFDVDVDGHAYRESTATEAGADAVTGEVLGIGIGMSVCYDLRFPELYRAHAAAGVRVLSVPANFTPQTGEAHWELLLRARAVENQCFVLAAGQCGTHTTGEGAWGHSMIIDPWGRVLAEVADGEGFATADLDFAAQDAIRASLPVLNHRRLP
jgi:predicted amidohydrolase